MRREAEVAVAGQVQAAGAGEAAVRAAAAVQAPVAQRVQAAVAEEGAGEAAARAPAAALAAPVAQRVRAATAAAPVRVLESAEAAVSEPGPVQRWALVSVLAQMPRSASARRLLSAPDRMPRLVPDRMRRKLPGLNPASGLGRDRPPAMGPVMEPAIRELDLKTAQVLGPLHSVRHM